MKLGSSLLLPVLAAASILLACGGDDDAGSSTGSSGAAPVDAGPAVCATPSTPTKVNASCEVTLDTPAFETVVHVPEGTQLTYCSNPPSSGRHYPVWTDFKEFTAPIEWPYLVHSLEHGAIVLLYKCDAGSCPEVLTELRRVRDAATDKCGAGKQRVIIAPSTTIPTRVAAAAWGATYAAECADGPTLDTFVRDHIGKGPEDICIPGRSFP